MAPNRSALVKRAVTVRTKHGTVTQHRMVKAAASTPAPTWNSGHSERIGRKWGGRVGLATGFVAASGVALQHYDKGRGKNVGNFRSAVGTLSASLFGAAAGSVVGKIAGHYAGKMVARRRGVGSNKGLVRELRDEVLSGVSGRSGAVVGGLAFGSAAAAAKGYAAAHGVRLGGVYHATSIGARAGWYYGSSAAQFRQAGQSVRHGRLAAISLAAGATGHAAHHGLGTAIKYATRGTVGSTVGGVLGWATTGFAGTYAGNSVFERGIRGGNIFKPNVRRRAR